MKKLTVTAKQLKEYTKLGKDVQGDNINSTFIAAALRGDKEVYMYDLTPKDIEALKKAGFKVKEEIDTYNDFEDTGDTDADDNKLFREVEREDKWWVVSW